MWGGIAWDIIHITLQWEWSSISQAGGSFVFYSGFPQRSADADTTLNITQEGGVNGLSLVLAPSLSQCVFRKCTNIPGWAVLLCWPTTGGIRLIAAACVCVCGRSYTQMQASQARTYFTQLVFLLFVIAALFTFLKRCLHVLNRSHSSTSGHKALSTPNAYLTLQP